MQPTPQWAPILWGLPFAGILLSIALFPILAPHLWHRRMGLIAMAWMFSLLLPEAVLQGVAPTAGAAWHAILLEYLPFVTLLLALFTCGGGVLMTGGPGGTPGGNTALLALGMVLAGIMGTTGISMVMIHPLLRANEHRCRKVHLVVFFILLVSNAGGATSPLGDPPLYIGFLHGVPFHWPLLNLLPPLLVLAYPLLAIFYLLDRHLAKSDPPPPAGTRLRLQGGLNLFLLAIVVASVLVQGVWHPGGLTIFGQSIGIERLVGMAVFITITLVSMATTPNAVRSGNLFSWEPMAEVGKLFLAIFITITPILATLASGPKGPLAPLLRLTEDASGAPIPAIMFWLTGLLSGFLDNAPTYLIFFEQAGGDPAVLTGTLNTTLKAIAAGAVFFGALSYVGNAPNMMVRSIAAQRGVLMPGFFAYTGWAALLLGPMLAVVTLLFFL
jgi:Na+/H+ antiporter NhaD/arsenite permease-like protein